MLIPILTSDITLSITGTAGSLNAGKLITPNVSMCNNASVENHLPVITELNIGTALSLDKCSFASVESAYIEKTAFVIAIPADTVGTAKGVLEGEGSGNKPSVNTCEVDVTREAACVPEDDDTAYANGKADLVDDTDMTNIESTSVDT